MTTEALQVWPKDKTFQFWDNPLGAGRKLNVHETFRRRPGRLLKVLCTFNLHPVSRGKSAKRSVSWIEIDAAKEIFTCRICRKYPGVENEKNKVIEGCGRGTEIILHDIKMMMIIRYTLLGKILAWRKFCEKALS